jgi:hypothetical protein
MKHYVLAVPSTNRLQTLNKRKYFLKNFCVELSSQIYLSKKLSKKHFINIASPDIQIVISFKEEALL